jgi:1-deoxy-11beta-hydroxypentalenate dehydrogenase
MADVSHPDDVERLADAAGGAPLVCLDAGVTSTAKGPVWEALPEEWSRVIDTNLGGVVNGLRSFLQRLLAAGEPAQVLITASLAGLATWPGGGSYVASKHAVVTVAEQAALALADSPIHVTVACPALVRSGLSEVGDDPLHVADEALAALNDRRFLSTGAVSRDGSRGSLRQISSARCGQPCEA